MTALWALNYGYLEEAKMYTRLSTEQDEEEKDRGVFD